MQVAGDRIQFKGLFHLKRVVRREYFCTGFEICGRSEMEDVSDSVLNFIEASQESGYDSHFKVNNLFETLHLISRRRKPVTLVCHLFCYTQIFIQV